jgi:hypothetical protein
MSKKIVVVGSLAGLVGIACVSVGFMITLKPEPQLTAKPMAPKTFQHAKAESVALVPQVEPRPSVAIPVAPTTAGELSAPPPVSVDMAHTATTSLVLNAAPIARTSDVLAQQPSVRAPIGVASQPLVASKATVTAIPLPEREPAQPTGLRSLQLAALEPKAVVPSVAVSAAAKPSRATDAVVVTAQRVQQVAHVDIDSLGRGNSLTIQLPKRRK